MKALIDGNITEITSTEWDEFQAYKKSQAKDWPQNGNRYWFIDSEGEVLDEESYYVDSRIDGERQSIGNIYRTESEALAQVEKLKAKARIDKYIRDNGLEFVPDWKNFAQRKFFITYDNSASVFVPYERSWGQCEVTHWLAAAAHAQQVIDNRTDDLKTLFGI